MYACTHVCVYVCMHVCMYAYSVEFRMEVEFCAWVLLLCHSGDVGGVPTGESVGWGGEKDDSSITCGGSCLQKQGYEFQGE